MLPGYVPDNVFVYLDVVRRLCECAVHKVDLYLAAACNFVVEVRCFDVVALFQNLCHVEPEFHKGVLERRRVVPSFSAYRVFAPAAQLRRHDLGFFAAVKDYFIEDKALDFGSNLARHAFVHQVLFHALRHISRVSHQPALAEPLVHVCNHCRNLVARRCQHQPQSRPVRDEQHVRFVDCCKASD